MGATHINPQLLVDLVSVRMPFGKYKGRILCDLPEAYLSWFHQKGFPPGEIGIHLSSLYNIKLTGTASHSVTENNNVCHPSFSDGDHLLSILK